MSLPKHRGGYMNRKLEESKQKNLKFEMSPGMNGSKKGKKAKKKNSPR